MLCQGPSANQSFLTVWLEDGNKCFSHKCFSNKCFSSLLPCFLLLLSSFSSCLSLCRCPSFSCLSLDAADNPSVPHANLSHVPSSHWECEELDLVICGSPDGDWSCHLSMSIGVGGGFGLFGIVMMGSFINLVRRVGRTHGLCDFFPVVLFFVGLFIACFICVLVWGGVDGATIVGIIWGTGLLVIIAAAFCCNLEEPTVAHARGGDYEMVQPTSAHKRTVDSS